MRSDLNLRHDAVFRKWPATKLVRCVWQRIRSERQHLRAQARGVSAASATHAVTLVAARVSSAQGAIGGARALGGRSCWVTQQA